jgi:hypothetical protein
VPVRRRAIAALVLLAATAAGGCSSLLTAEPTPVPGAAATLTRSLRTPIPTTAATPGASPAVSPVASRAAIAPSPSPATGQSAAADEIARVQGRIDQILSRPTMPGIDGLLLDHVSLSTAQGGSVMDATQAAGWLRDHAGPTVKVSRIERGTQSLMLQVYTDGWPPQDPIQQGLVNFSLRKYDASGRQNDETGDWKIDVIDAE